MGTALLKTLATAAVLICLIRILGYWLRSIPKAILLLFSLLSVLYQLAFLLDFHLLFTLIDIAAVLSCVYFGKFIFIESWKSEEAVFYLLYFFIGYLFFLSILAVPGWNWDSMVYHLPKSFLYLNEGTIFTPHYSDGRQALWPMGGEILYHLFTRHGDTFGTGFLQFVFYCGTLMIVHQTALAKTDRKNAALLTFLAASMPVLVYGATTVKTDMATLFAFLMMWSCYEKFRQNRSREDLFFIFLAFAFGMSSKLTFIFLGPLSLSAFAWIEWREKKPGPFFQGENFSWRFWIPVSLGLLFLAQAHLFIYNLICYGHPAQDIPLSYLATRKGTPWNLMWIPIVQDFAKYHLMLFDFVLPLSFADIPFVDTALNFFYNHTVGAWTGDQPWNYQYFPEEMRGAFGPFAILALWAAYRTAFKKSAPFPKAFALVFLIWIPLMTYLVPWGPVSGIRYLGTVLVGGLIFLPLCYESKILRFRKTLLGLCAAQFAFCLFFNYGSPLIAYHSKAVPWYRYAFTDRGYLYSHKYFMDQRMDIYRRQIENGEKVFIFSYLSDWIFPYYHWAPQAKIRLGNYRDHPETWSQTDFAEYDWVICNEAGTPLCIQDWDRRKNFQKIWKSEPGNPKMAAFYRRIQ